MNANSFIVTTGLLGNQIITSGNLPDLVAREQIGLVVDAVSPYWGGAEFIYARFGGTVRQFGLTTLLPLVASGAYRFDMTEVANTANLGRAVYIAMTSGTVGQFGWFMKSGISPVNCNASVAADTAFGIVAAGQGGAVAAGKQILGGRVAVAATATVAKTGAQGNSGSFQIIVPNADGWFMGAYLSGTGVGAATQITDISPDGKIVTVSVANSAAINGTVTATYNNATIFYNVAHVNNPVAQGPIT